MIGADIAMNRRGMHLLNTQGVQLFILSDAAKDDFAVDNDDTYCTFQYRNT